MKLSVLLGVLMSFARDDISLLDSTARESMKREREQRAIIAATATVVHHRGRALMSRGSTLQFVVIIGLGYLVVLFIQHNQSSSGIEHIQVSLQ